MQFLYFELHFGLLKYSRECKIKYQAWANRVLQMVVQFKFGPFGFGQQIWSNLNLTMNLVVWFEYKFLIKSAYIYIDGAIFDKFIENRSINVKYVYFHDNWALHNQFWPILTCITDHLINFVMTRWIGFQKLTQKFD